MWPWRRSNRKVDSTDAGYPLKAGHLRRFPEKNLPF